MVEKTKLTTIAETPLKWCSVALSEIMELGTRLDASVYDIESRKAIELLNSCKFSKRMLTGDNGIATAYVLGRFKRIWVETSKYPIYQPSSIVNICPEPDGYISKLTHTNIERLRVHKGQILMTCSGSIGKTSFVAKTLDNKIFSHDLLRIDCNDKADTGYVYAYLQTKVGNKILLSNKYGAVITHIEPEHLSNIPVPYATREIRIRINNLIVASYELRDRSNELLDEATKLLITELHLPPIRDFDEKTKVNTFSVKLSELDYRADASYHLPSVNKLINHLKRYAKEVTTVGDERVSKAVVLPGRFKRVYVEEGHGIPFFGGRSIGELNPSDKKYLSFAQHAKKIREELTIHENMIVVTCSGTIGNIAFVPKHWDSWAMTHDIIRIIGNNDFIGYLYVWLQSVYAAVLLKRASYGTVVQHIEKEHIFAIAVPLLKNDAVQKKINELALQANELRYQAYCKEQEAIKIMNEEVIFAK